MAIVTAYQCDQTKRLFSDKEKYVRHLKKLARKNLIKKRFNRMQAEFNQVMNTMWHTCDSIEALEQYLYTNWEYFALNALRQAWPGPPVNISAANIVLGYIEFEKMAWQRYASNTHSCPINGVTNWSQSASQPIGYPGWVGKVNLIVGLKNARSELSFGSDFFRGTGINTGTGGSRNFPKTSPKWGPIHESIENTYPGIGNIKSYGYAVNLFADDFVAMRKNFEEYKLEQKLKDEPEPDFV